MPPPVRSDVSQFVPIAGRRAMMVLPNTARRNGRRTRANSEADPSRTPTRSSRNKASLLATALPHQQGRGRVFNGTSIHGVPRESRHQPQSPSQGDQSYIEANDTSSCGVGRQSSRVTQSPSQRIQAYVESDETLHRAGRQLSRDHQSPRPRRHQYLRFEDTLHRGASRQLSRVPQFQSQENQFHMPPNHILYLGVDRQSNRVPPSPSEMSLNLHPEDPLPEASAMHNEQQLAPHEPEYDLQVADGQDIEEDESLHGHDYEGLSRVSELRAHVLNMIPKNAHPEHREGILIGLPEASIPWDQFVAFIETKYHCKADKLLIVDQDNLNRLFKEIESLIKEKAELEDENNQLADECEHLRESVGAARYLLG